MNSGRILLSILALSASGMGVAHADTFNFSFGTSANDFYASGTFSGNMITPGEYRITGITGTTTTGTAHANSSIDAVQTFDGNDNDLFVSALGVGTLDTGGISYMLDNGAELNLKATTTGDAEILKRAGGNLVNESLPVTITRLTPEPGSLVLLGTGILGVAGAVRRRFSI